MTLYKQQPQVREGYKVKINGKFVGEENVLVFFLGEKCFYTTGCQRSLSHLPWGPCEPEVVDRVKRLIAISPRFPGKVRFMGIYAKPLPELIFDGRIFLKII